MAAVKTLLRLFSYLFHGLLALFLIAVSGLALASGAPSLRLDMLPWTGSTLAYVVFAGAALGLVTLLLALGSKWRILFLHLEPGGGGSARPRIFLQRLPLSGGGRLHRARSDGRFAAGGAGSVVPVVPAHEAAHAVLGRMRQLFHVKQKQKLFHVKQTGLRTFLSGHR